MLDLYSDYLISQNKYATATGLSDVLNGEISHDKVTRFLRQNNYSSKDLWDFVKPDVRKIEKRGIGFLMIDDFIEEKPYTDENEIVAWHYSHAKHRILKGTNLISSMIRYDDSALPVAYEVIKKDIKIEDAVSKKIKRKSSVTKNEYFRKLINQANKNQVIFQYVLADTWFSSKENMKYINNIGKKFVLGIKSNRLASLTKDGQRQQIKDLQFKENEKMIVFLKDLSFSLALIKKIFKNEDNSTGILYLVTNDLTLDADQIYETYQRRWFIEEFHKSIKQNASLAKSPTKTVRTQLNHIFASIIAYCKLEFIKFKTNLNHFSLKYKLLVKANQATLLELQILKNLNFA